MPPPKLESFIICHDAQETEGGFFDVLGYIPGGVIAPGKGLLSQLVCVLQLSGMDGISDFHITTEILVGSTVVSRSNTPWTHRTGGDHQCHIYRHHIRPF
ncbi:hypothetical protein ACFL59_09350, partial [Planctomycetota bacterium]